MVIVTNEPVFENDKVDYIFNPVSENINYFSDYIKYNHYSLFEDYQKFLYDNLFSVFGELNIVCFKSRAVCCNSVVVNREEQIDLFQLTKTLVESCNLCYEYKLSIGIQFRDNDYRNIELMKRIRQIIDVVFENTDIDVYLYIPEEY